MELLHQRQTADLSATERQRTHNPPGPPDTEPKRFRTDLQELQSSPLPSTTKKNTQPRSLQPKSLAHLLLRLFCCTRIIITPLATKVKVRCHARTEVERWLVILHLRLLRLLLGTRSEHKAVLENLQNLNIQKPINHSPPFCFMHFSFPMHHS